MNGDVLVKSIQLPSELVPHIKRMLDVQKEYAERAGVLQEQFQKDMQLLADSLTEERQEVLKPVLDLVGINEDDRDFWAFDIRYLEDLGIVFLQLDVDGLRKEQLKRRPTGPAGEQ